MQYLSPHSLTNYRRPLLVLVFVCVTLSMLLSLLFLFAGRSSVSGALDSIFYILKLLLKSQIEGIGAIVIAVFVVLLFVKQMHKKNFASPFMPFVFVPSEQGVLPPLMYACRQTDEWSVSYPMAKTMPHVPLGTTWAFSEWDKDASQKHNGKLDTVRLHQQYQMLRFHNPSGYVHVLD